MPKISLLPASDPKVLSWTDLVVGVVAGVTDRILLSQLRDLFGTGTNIFPVPTYPADANTNPAYGKLGDLLLTGDTNNLYQRTASGYPDVSLPTLHLAGTKVDDAALSPLTSWSSQKIDSFIRGAVAVVMDLAPNAARRVPFFSKVLLESLRVSFGPDSFQVRLLLADGTVITSASGTGAACIGQVSASITNLTAAQVALGYNVEFTNTGGSVLTALVRTIPVS